MSVDGLFILLVAVGLAFFVGSPLFQQRFCASMESAETRELEQLTLHKETIYTAIRDLDFDFQTDKVDHHDYRELRHHLEAEAVELLQRIDEVDPLAGIDDEIERQILAVRQRLHTPNMKQALQGLCSNCHAVRQGDEKFCPFCGQPLPSV
jgi:hypothetical protein